MRLPPEGPQKERVSRLRTEIRERTVALVERKEALRDLLESLVLEKSVIRFSDYVVGKGDRFFQGICELGVEGTVSKKAQSRYVGRRSREWLKVKCRQQQNFVISGFTQPAPVSERSC